MNGDDMKQMTALDYINILEPDHSRMSCEEGQSNNAVFIMDGHTYNYCNRCTLFAIMQLGETL